METRPLPTRTLNETLLLQLERLADPSLTGKSLEEERARSRTMVDLAQTAIAERRLELDHTRGAGNGRNTTTPHREETGQERRTDTAEESAETAPVPPARNAGAGERASAEPRPSNAAGPMTRKSEAKTEPEEADDTASPGPVLDGASQKAIAAAKRAQEMTAKANATGTRPEGVSERTLQRYRRWMAEGLRRYGSELAGLIRQRERPGGQKKLDNAQTALLEHVVRSSATKPGRGRTRWAAERLNNLCNEVGVRTPSPETLRRALNNADAERADRAPNTPTTSDRSSESPNAQPEPAGERGTEPVAATTKEAEPKRTRGCTPPATSAETTDTPAAEPEARTAGETRHEPGPKSQETPAKGTTKQAEGPAAARRAAASTAGATTPRPPQAKDETAPEAAPGALRGADEVTGKPATDEKAATTERRAVGESGEQDTTDNAKAQAVVDGGTDKAPAAARKAGQPRRKAKATETVPHRGNKHTLRRYHRWMAEERRLHRATSETAAEPVAAEPNAVDEVTAKPTPNEAAATTDRQADTRSEQPGATDNPKAQWVFDGATNKALAAAKKAQKIVLEANATGRLPQGVCNRSLKRYRKWMADGLEHYGSELAGLIRNRGRWASHSVLNDAQRALLDHVVKTSAGTPERGRERRAERQLDSLCNEVGVETPSHKTLRRALKNTDAPRADKSPKTRGTSEGLSERAAGQPKPGAESRTEPVAATASPAAATASAATPKKTPNRTAPAAGARTTPERAAKPKTTVTTHYYPGPEEHKAPEKGAAAQAEQPSEAPKRPSKPGLAFAPRAEPVYESVVDFRAKGRNRGLLRPITAFGHKVEPRKAPPAPPPPVQVQLYTGTDGSKLWNQPKWHRKKWTEAQWAGFEEYKASMTNAQAETPEATEWRIKDERRPPKKDETPDESGQRTT